VIPALLIGLFASTGSAAPKDSGLVACAYPLATQDVPAADYPKIRAEFADSRWQDLRTAGTAYIDLAVQLLHAGHRRLPDRLVLPAAVRRLRKARTVNGRESRLLLARAGHEVLVLERDCLRPAPDVESAAAAAFRPTAPQIVQPHIVMAQCRQLLIERLPDVHAGVLAAGVTEAPLGGCARLSPASDRVVRPAADHGCAGAPASRPSAATCPTARTDGYPRESQLSWPGPQPVTTPGRSPGLVSADRLWRVDDVGYLP
jgi:hypothetical protein